MAESTIRLPRIEGHAYLARNDEGHVTLRGPRGQGLEDRLTGMAPLDAPHLVQHIGADGGVAHTLAATAALEAAAGITPAHMGQTLRALLLNLSILHAHLRQFYTQALPDYLPMATLADYKGAMPGLDSLAKSLAGKPRDDWSQDRFTHPFTSGETGRLWERRARMEKALGHLQRMMAMLGGKFPVIMSVVPGGVTMTPSRAQLLRLGLLFHDVREFITNGVLEDVRLIIQRYPDLATLGKGSEDFLVASPGEVDVDSPQRWAIPGIFLQHKLDTFGAVATEDIHSSFYQIARGGKTGVVAAVDPGKSGAYSWIKSPRYQGRPMETGPMARMLIAYLSGTRQWGPELVDEVERITGQALQQGNTVAGRLLARAGELTGLAEHVARQLSEVDPDQPTVSAGAEALTHLNGEGLGFLEGPAGAVQHRLIVENGRIAHYDIISPNTWNAAPRGGDGLRGSLEQALNAEKLDFSNQRNRLALSRIVHSFALSMSDATH